MLTTPEIQNDRPKASEIVVANSVQCELDRRLKASPYMAIQQLRCDFHEGIVVLRGRVPTYYTRQVVLSLVMKVVEVTRVDDRIDVTFDSKGRIAEE